MVYSLEETKTEFDNICKNWNISENEKNKIWNNIKDLNFTSPKAEDVFNAFKIGENENIIKPEEVNVLIIGQDPYPSKGKNKERAHGFAFSFGNNAKPADSLKNIFIAIYAYINKMGFNEVDVKNIIGNKKEKIEPWKTNLKIWASNNKVLLLNTALTYKEDKNGKNQKREYQTKWHDFVKNIITNLLTSSSNKLVVFLWGKDAQALFLECVNSFGINICDHNLTNEIINNKDVKQKTKKISRKLLCLSTGHPTPNYDNVHKYGFSEDAPDHFAACDKFLEDENGQKLNIWKDFPENNTEDYYKNKK